VNLRSRLLLLAALGGGALLVGVELMITAVALPAIVDDLADWTQLRRASWIVNGYLLAYIATMPLAGRAADRYGLPRLFVLSLLVFAVGSFFAGAARDLDQLIAARVVQGVGAGAIVPLATAGASHLFSGAARARALGVVGALTFLGMAVGPFAGTAVLEGLDLGPLLERTGMSATLAGSLLAPAWRWVFYLGVPLALLALVYTWAASPAWPRPDVRPGLDVIGATLFTTALATGLLAVTGLQERETGGPTPAELGAIAGIAALLSVVRFWRARHPFLELRFFRNVTFSSAVLVSLLTGYALATVIVGAAVFVDRVRYAGPSEQRFVLGTLAAAMAIGALGSGLALRYLRIVPLSVGGLVMGVAGLALLALADPTSPLPDLALGVGLFGLGFGLTVTPRSTAAVEALGRAAFGLASAGVTVARMIGMAVGLAVLTFLGSDRIEALSVVLVDPVARDAVLPEPLRGRPLEDGLVVDALETWASVQAAGILAGLFAIAAVVTAIAVLPAMAMRRTPRPATMGTPASDTGGTGGDGNDEARPALAL
jgi:MFS family permease